MNANLADAAALGSGLVLPAIVALVTRPSTNSTVKGLAHALLAVGTGFYAVYRTDPQHIQWAPAVIAAFLAWLSGTAFYHSLLKKYTWFQRLQNALVRDAKNFGVSGEVGEVVKYLTEAVDAEESGPSNNFPLSTDTPVAPTSSAQV